MTDKHILSMYATMSLDNSWKLIESGTYIVKGFKKDELISKARSIFDAL